MQMLQIKNWHEWQTYRKDRGSPPWIKVHRKLLSNPKWSFLSDADKGQIVSIWIVAADNDGIVPSDANVLRKICQLDNAPDVNKFIELGFLTSACQPHDVNVMSQWRGDDAQQNYDVADESLKTVDKASKKHNNNNALHDGCQDDAKMTPTCQPVDAPEAEAEAEAEADKKKLCAISASAQKSDFGIIFDFGSGLFRNLEVANTAPIRGWIAKGVDPELDALPVIKAVAERNTQVSSWGYFTKAIEQATSNRRAGLPPPKGVPKPKFETPQDRVKGGRI